MRLTFILDNREHWVEVDDEIIWTRNLRREWVEKAVDDDLALPMLREWIEDMHLYVGDKVYEDPDELTPEILDDMHPALIRFIYQIPSHATAEQSQLGNVSGGRSSVTA